MIEKSYGEMARRAAWSFVGIPDDSKMSMEKISFSLVYGAEALIPVEIGKRSLIFSYTTKESNEKALTLNIDSVEGNWEWL